VCYFQTMKLPLLEILVCNNFKYSDLFVECCELDVIVNGDRWTYYDLGCMYELWFEILRDFMDYRDYMSLSLVVWLYKWSLSGLISYNLGGSVTERIHSHAPVFETLDGLVGKVMNTNIIPLIKIFISYIDHFCI